MEQISNFKYRVSPQTAVTVRLAAVQTAPTIAAVLDGQVLHPKDSCPTDVCYEFTVGAAGDRHRLLMEFRFESNDPESAHYTVDFDNSDGDSCPARPIKNGTAIPDPQYTFKVV